VEVSQAGDGLSPRRERVAVVVEGAARRRWPRVAAAMVALLLLLFFGGGGWYFSGQIRSDALLVDEPSPEYDYTVIGVSTESITLELPGNPAPDLISGETLGVRWDGGYGLSGTVISRTGGAVAKTFTILTGTPPEPGVNVALEGAAVPPDPADAGIVYETVIYSSAFGEFEAWFIDGHRTTWAVFVHGRGSTRHEGIRVLPAFRDRGIPTLLIQYRNDPGAPATGDQLATFGVEEWRDLEGAVRYALDHGASDVILVGFSMGGAISLSMLYESDLAAAVSAVVLDAPALELGAMVDARAGETSLPLLPMEVPMVLTTIAKKMASLRFGADWGAMDYLDDRVGLLDVPILILHGVADGTVPITLSRELADTRPDLVELVEFRDADHVRAWNVDTGRYMSAVGSFLDRVSP